MLLRFLAGVVIAFLFALGGWYALPWVIDLQAWEAKALREAETRWKWRVVSEGVRPAWFPPGTLHAPRYRFFSPNAERPWGELSGCQFRPAWRDLLIGSVRVAGGVCERFSAGSFQGGATIRNLRFANEGERFTFEGDVESLGPLEAPLRLLASGSRKQGGEQERSSPLRRLAGAFRTDEGGFVIERFTLAEGGTDSYREEASLSVSGRIDGRNHQLDLQVSGRFGNKPFRLAVQGPADHPRLRLEPVP